MPYSITFFQLLSIRIESSGGPLMHILSYFSILAIICRSYMAWFYEQRRQKILSGGTNVKFIVIKFLSVRELGTFRNASMLAYLSNCYNNYDLFKSELVASKLTLYSKFPFWKGEIDGKPDLHFLNTNTLERDLP